MALCLVFDSYLGLRLLFLNCLLFRQNRHYYLTRRSTLRCKSHVLSNLPR